MAITFDGVQPSDSPLFDYYGTHQSFKNEGIAPTHWLKRPRLHVL